MSARHLSIRSVPAPLAKALEAEVRRRRLSLNGTVIQLLSTALGVGEAIPPRNGLEKLAGGWTDADHRRFEKATAVFERVDDELWR